MTMSCPSALMCMCVCVKKRASRERGQQQADGGGAEGVCGAALPPALHHQPGPACQGAFPRVFKNPSA